MILTLCNTVVVVIQKSTKLGYNDDPQYYGLNPVSIVEQVCDGQQNGKGTGNYISHNVCRSSSYLSHIFRCPGENLTGKIVYKTFCSTQKPGVITPGPDQLDTQRHTVGPLQQRQGY